MVRAYDILHEISSMYFVPEDCRWNNAVTGGELQNPYSFIGIGQELDGMGIR